MPRSKKLYKKTTVEPIELDDEADPDSKIEDGDSDLQDALRSVAGGSGVIKLYRILPQGGRPKFLTDVEVDMFNETYVQDAYGGGIYKIRVRKENGKWAGTTFEIEGPPKKVQYQEEEDDEDEPSGYNPHQAQPVQPVQQGIDPLTLMKMMQAAEERGEARLLKMMEIMKPQAQPPDVTKQVFDIVEKIAPMMAGGEGGGSPWMMALTQFKEPILKIVDSISVALNRPAVAPVMRSMPPNPPVQQVPHEHLHTHTEEPDVILLMLKAYLPMFVSAASKGSDPVLYADMVLDQVPENQYTKLKAWLDRADCLEDLVKIEPVIRAQQAWWTELRAALIQALIQELTPHGTSSVQSGAPTDELEESD